MIACDVETRFVDAARIFGPQKGATAKQVELLERRLVALVDGYKNDYGVDLTDVDGAGAAGGLAGGLVVLGGHVVRGVDAVADEVELDDRIEEVALVVTGEGFLDGASFAGKVVGGVVERSEWASKPVCVLVGDSDDEGRAAAALCEPPPDVISLTEQHGVAAARADTTALVRAEISRYLSSFGQ